MRRSAGAAAAGAGWDAEVVLRTEKQDGDAALVNLAERASQPYEALPLFDGAMDRVDDATTVAVLETRGGVPGERLSYAKGLFI